MGAKRRKAGVDGAQAEDATACGNLFAANSKFHIANYSHTQAAPEVLKAPSKPSAAGATEKGGQGSPSSSESDDDDVPQAATTKKAKGAKKVNGDDAMLNGKTIAPDKDRAKEKTEKKQGATKSKDELLRELEDQALDRTIFIGNLAESTTKKQLKKRFRPYGAIESIRFRSMLLKKDSRVPRRVAAAAGTVDEERGSHHAYIVYEDASSVSKALQENMKVLDDRHIRVDRAAVNNMRVKLLGAKKGSRAAAELVGSSHQVQYDISKTIFVGNLPLQVEDEELIRFIIAGLGTGSESLIQAVRVVRDPKTSVGKGIAFVLFKNRGARKQALGLNGKSLQGRKLRISEAQADGSTEAAQYKRSGNNSQKSKPWQGTTSSKSGRVRGGVAKKTGSAYAKTLKNASKRPQMPKRTGKRPAVAARKAAARKAARS